jgi:twinkle protein
MSTHISKIACPVCGSSDGLNIFEEDGVRTGYCFSSKHNEDTKYFNSKALSEIPESDVVYVEKEPKDISWVEELQTLSNPERGLLKGAYKHFDVRHGVSRQDGRTITETYYPLLDDTSEKIGYKVRIHEPKDFYVLGTSKRANPFGWKQALEVGGYTLYITEGEEDSVALFTAWMREKKQKVAVISLKQGADSVVKTLQPVLKHITDKWKQVVFLPDMDDAGEVATKAIRALFPADFTVKIAKYTEKDSNEMVKKGKEKELVSSCYNAGTPLSSAIKEFTLEDFEVVKKAPEFGISFPYEGLTEMLRGIRLGTTIYIGAPEKSGKSTLVNEIATHLMLTHNEPIFAIKPEESEEGTLRRMAGSAVGKVFHDPKVKVNPEDVNVASNLLAGKLFVLERTQTPDWQEVRQLMREAYLSRGIKYFFIDPITNLTSNLSNSEKDTFLHQMTREVAEDAKSLGYTVFLFCHLKTVKDGLSWGEGRVGTADDLAGSRAMAQACDVAIIMQAWMLTEGENFEYLNRRRVLHVVREREYNAIGRVELLWNSYKGKLEEVKQDD